MSALLCLVMEWFDPHVSQDAKVARAASHHCPEQIIITIYQLVSSGKFAGKMREVNSINGYQGDLFQILAKKYIV